jgi:hypothetical protein
VLITAFTIGHCSTLLLSTFNIVSVRTGLTEFFIALTIIFTAFSNAFVIDLKRRKKFRFIYFMALLFGMIHGLGFAYGIKSILGRDENITWQLLAFNTGIETAQLIVVSVILSISFVIVRILQVTPGTYVLFASGIIFGLGLQMAIERNPFKNNKNETTYFLPYDTGKYYCYRPVPVL